MDWKKCGACCIAPSITTPMPNMPAGKPPGVRCANLNDTNECTLYGQAQRPAFCAGWQPTPELCGGGFDQAMKNVAILEENSA